MNMMVARRVKTECSRSLHAPGQHRTKRDVLSHLLQLLQQTTVNTICNIAAHPYLQQPVASLDWERERQPLLHEPQTNQSHEEKYVLRVRVRH